MGKDAAPNDPIEQRMREVLIGGIEPQEVVVAGDRAFIRWHYRFGPAPSDWVSGVNIMRVRDGRITEALGYSKTSPVAG